MATKDKPQFAHVLDKEPGFKQAAFAEWIEAHTGYEIDVKSVQLALSLTGEWRKSDELAELREGHVTVRDQKAAEAAERKATKAAAKREKLLAELAALDETVVPVTDEAETEVEPEPAPTPAKKAPAKKAPAKKAAPAKKPAASVVDDDEF